MSEIQTDRELPLDAVGTAELMRKVTRRLIPFLFFLYIIAYLDRVNVGFAQIKMKPDLGFNDAIFGIGSGIFFIGYFFFEIPSNLILERVGARRWIARIMFTWGLLAMAMIFVHDKWSFYGLRFLLGAAEAGFFPGVILFLTYWFTRAERARIIALFMTATAVANMIGSPISGALLEVSGFGLKSWQWLFILEGFPAVALGFVVLAYLPDGPHNALWLNEAERERVHARLLTDRQSNPIKHVALRDAVHNPYVWLLSLLYFLLVVPQYGVAMWLPQIVKGFSGLKNWQVGMVTGIPYFFAAMSMVLVAGHSDRTGERPLHVAIPGAIGATGLLASALVPYPWLKLLVLIVAAAGMWGTLGPFWTLPTSILGGTAAAGGIALINSIGNLGGFVGPFAVGWIKTQTHSFTWPIVTLATFMYLASLTAVLARAVGLAARQPLQPSGQ
jgi:ACS family tartrate transporter-like MFS transporter